MASGETLIAWNAWDGYPPSANFATQDFRNGHPVMDFDDTTDETLIFVGIMPRHYANGGVTITLIWMATTATSNTCRWETAFERDEDGGTDLDADSFATANSAGGTAPATSGAARYTTIAHTSGAQMDSVAVGERFRLLVRRDANGTTGTDNVSGDAELLNVEIRET